MKHRNFIKIPVTGLIITIVLAGMATNAMSGNRAGTDAGNSGLLSVDTGFTVSKVRTARKDGVTYVVASSYEGTVLGVGYNGKLLWKNALSGFMNRDLWCADITGNGSDEILAANADGTLYCLNAKGRVLWKFRKNDAPMNAACVIHKDGKPYVVCGGYDKKIYYLSPNGELIKTLDSKGYSKEKPWGKDDKRIPPKFVHIANFLRPIRRMDGTEALAVHGVFYSNSAAGHLYCFEPLEETPYKIIKAKGGVGELRAADIDGDGSDEVLTGATSMVQDAVLNMIGIDTESQNLFEVSSLKKLTGGNGYRVVQPELVKDEGKDRIFVLFGSKIFLLPTDLKVDPKNTEVLSSRFSFNDMWKDGDRIVLASAQSGGSCVHVLNLGNPGWKEAYANLVPPGKISAILENTAEARDQLKSFQRPEWERESLPVWFMSESREGSGGPFIEAIESAGYTSPLFLNGKHLPRVENVDRSSFDDVYRKKRDRRKKYVLNSDEMVDQLLPEFEGAPGISYWGGHGNDPFQTSLETQKKIFDAAKAKGKKVVTIYPELEHYDEHFAWVMENHFYPMANYAQGRNANIFVRTKHAFWHSIVYLPMWNDLLSGKYADVFIPALEETTDKTMEQSVAARLGIWASGAVDQWGARCARDNTSFDRLRQFSHQELPNHFLRQMVYNISCGATYLNNFSVDQEYMSFLWELIAKGALYVPQRNELVNLSPVHIGMTEPDEYFLDTGNNAKWLTFYDEQEEKDNPMVFGRLNGTWPGAPVTEWDFSRYAAGVNERRLNYLPTYENGIVMLTPPQHGKFADQKAPRGKMADHLHPLYATIMKEYISNGRNYISNDGKKIFAANEYYKTIEADIKESAKLLPLTVSGDVAWVCAQTSPTHLRLTLIDGGYINPDNRSATVTFHTVKPKRMTSLLDGKTFKMGKSIEVDIPCGLFRFIDIELEEAL